MAWHDALQTASFRGVEFHTISVTVGGSRRTVVHEYPQRNEVWVEDVSGGARTISFEAYVNVAQQTFGSVDALRNAISSIALAGGDFPARDDLLTRLREPGVGTLVHPSLGSLDAVCTALAVEEGTETGNIIRFQIEFTESAAQIYPLSTQALTSPLALADRLSLSSALAFVRRVRQTVGRATAVIRNVVRTVQAVRVQITRTISGVAALIGTVRGLPAALGVSFGRFSFGSRKTPQRGVATTAAASARLSEAQRVTTARVAALAADPASDLDAYASSIAGTVRSMRDVYADPADAVAAFAQLASLQSPSDPASAAATAYVRRCAIVELCRVVPDCYLASSDDAQALLDTVTGVIDAEITYAGDTGDDEVYTDLRALRASVARDLVARGTDRAPLKDVAFADSVPAFLAAQWLYLDGARADELIERVRPVHPAFMPRSFRALAR